jgi:Ankyrin repeats (many copies)
LVNVRNKKGWTALFCASSSEENELLVNYLLENSADPDVTDNQGNTCLHIVFRAHRGFECVKLLVDHMKTTINCKHLKQETPLLLTASSGDARFDAFLIESSREALTQT